MADEKKPKGKPVAIIGGADLDDPKAVNEFVAMIREAGAKKGAKGGEAR